MKRISRITVQKNNPHRFNIFLTDGKEETFGFGVDEDVLISHRLMKNQELDEGLIKKLLQEDSLQKTYAMAINYLSYRMRSEKEIKDYLMKKEVNPEHIPITIKRLKDEKLLDDRQFAQAFIQTRLQTSSKGPVLIQNELRAKGVSEHICQDVLSIYSYDLQYEKALKWAEKRSASGKKQSHQMQIQQLRGSLIRKGFTQDVIQDVIRDIQHHKDDEVEWEAVMIQGNKLLRRYTGKFTGFELQAKLKEGLFRRGFTFDLIQKYIMEYVVEDE